MFSGFFWLLAVIGLVSQIICYLFGKSKFIRILPMITVCAIVVLTLLIGIAAGGLGAVVSFALIWNEIKILVLTSLGYVICRIVMFAKK